VPRQQMWGVLFTGKRNFLGIHKLPPPDLFALYGCDTNTHVHIMGRSVMHIAIWNIRRVTKL
jgi:hypothetical protein